jgi:hypothetical protein
MMKRFAGEQIIGFLRDADHGFCLRRATSENSSLD